MVNGQWNTRRVLIAKDPKVSLKNNIANMEENKSTFKKSWAKIGKMRENGDYHMYWIYLL